jgi:hypothetical protein
VTAVSAWEPIEGFRSPGEFERFQRWIDERVAAGEAERVPVAAPWMGANTHVEHWIRDTEDGSVWRLIEPDPPARGLFEPVEPDAPAGRWHPPRRD